MINHNNLIIIFTIIPLIGILSVLLLFLLDTIRFYRIKSYIKKYQKDLYDLCKNEVDDYICKNKMENNILERDDISRIYENIYGKLFNIISKKKIKKYNIDDIVSMQIRNTVIHIFRKYHFKYSYYSIAIEGWDDLNMYRGE